MESNSLSGSTGLGASDRQLLEDAAKAAGYKGRWHEYTNADPAFVIEYDEPTAHGTTGAHWNPLTDDGDALRLAVKLRLHVDHSRTGDVCVWVFARDGAAHDFEEQSDDQYADTRRAITRAAASIGAQS